MSRKFRNTLLWASALSLFASAASAQPSLMPQPFPLADKIILKPAVAPQVPDEEIPTQEAKPTPEAQDLFRDGLAYYEGRGSFIGTSYRTAAELFEEAAELNHPEALFYIASMYNEGKGVPEDRGYSEELFGRAARLGQPDSQMVYGLLQVFKAIKSKPGSPEEAEFLRQAARWMKNPAEKGIADAEFFYGDMLIKGSGIAKNEALGMEYLRKSANKNNANSQAMLGADYWQGIGVKKDNIEAMKWLLLAHHGKNSNAQAIILNVAAEMTLEQKQKASDAAESWLKAYEKAHAQKPREKKPRFDFLRLGH